MPSYKITLKDKAIVRDGSKRNPSTDRLAASNIRLFSASVLTPCENPTQANVTFLEDDLRNRIKNFLTEHNYMYALVKGVGVNTTKKKTACFLAAEIDCYVAGEQAGSKMQSSQETQIENLIKDSGDIIKNIETQITQKSTAKIKDSMKKVENVTNEINKFVSMKSDEQAKYLMDKARENLIQKNIEKFTGIKNEFFAVSWSQDQKNTARDVIRGTLNVTFNEQHIMEQAQEKIHSAIEKTYEQNIKKILEEQEKKAINIISEYQNTISDIQKKYEKIMDAENLTKRLSGGIDKVLDQIGINDKVFSTTDKIDSFLTGIGVQSDMSGMLKNVIGSYKESFSKSLVNQINAQIPKQVKLVSIVREKVKLFKDYIEEKKKYVTELINKWKDTAMQKIKEMEAHLINSALGSLKKSMASGIKLSF